MWTTIAIGIAIIMSCLAAGVGIALILGWLISRNSVIYEGPAECLDCDRVSCDGCPLNIGE